MQIDSVWIVYQACLFNVNKAYAYTLLIFMFVPNTASFSVGWHLELNRDLFISSYFIQFENVGFWPIRNKHCKTRVQVGWSRIE